MGDRALVSYLAAAMAGIAGYFLLPSPAQNLAFIASNLTAATVILLRVRRGRLRPAGGWLLMAAFPIATGVGNSIYFVNDSLLHIAPFPSYGDAAFLGGYVLLAAGLLRLQRARSTGWDHSAVLDTAIITIGFTVASWVAFMAPTLHDSDTPMLHRLVALGYPAADVLVLAVAARFLLSARRRSPAYAWLAGTVVVMLVADTTFALLNLFGLYSTGHPIDALILAYNLGWGAVALHPRANDLAAAPADQQTERPNWPRLAALSVASLIAPAVLILQVTTENFAEVVVTSAAAALLFLLAVARMAGLVVQLEKVLAQRHALQGELSYRATHDELTKLANRREFTEQLDRALRAHPDGGVTVLFLDLDRFKTVNDTLGHGAGDTLLTVVADRLRAELRTQDIVARLGGDEFAVLLGAPAVEGERPDLVAARLAFAVSLPVRLHGLDVQVGISIGTAVANPGQSLEHLVHRADRAMYASKAATKAAATTALS